MAKRAKDAQKNANVETTRAKTSLQLKLDDLQAAYAKLGTPDPLFDMIEFMDEINSA